MTRAAEESPDNLVRLDLSPFSRADLDKIEALGKKLRLLYRWSRSERITKEGCGDILLSIGGY